MRAVILGAGRMSPLGGQERPKCLFEGIAGWRVLDWIQSALARGAGVEDLLFVGGDGAERIRKAYPQLRVRVNDAWSRQHVVGSLMSVRDELDRPFLFSYADVVYRPEVVRRLQESRSDIAIVIDRSWRQRFAGRPQSDLHKAEKVQLRGGCVRRIGRDIELGEPIDGEFIGLTRFTRQGAEALLATYDALLPLYAKRNYRGASDLDNAALSDLLQELIDHGHAIEAIAIDGDWAELDDPRDLTQFVFGTKAETLERIRPVLTSATILQGVTVQVGDWLRGRQRLARELADSFPSGELAVRSSARAEDTSLASCAGRYESVLGVASDSATAIAEAVDRVVASYARDGGGEDDQVLIQPQLRDVTMSGVLMTRELDRGAPYVVINYDELSGRTDSITAGDEGTQQVVRLHRELARPRDARLAALLACADELEAITGSDALDVEFAFDGAQRLHILQVRPIAARRNWKHADQRAHRAALRAAEQLLERRLGEQPGVPGTSSILGQMPDWNPAEMLGPHPLPLALSLYETLITDQAWRVGRAALDYADLFPHRLMLEIAGRPYVDVRLSLNNLLPATLHQELRGRIVDAGLARLREQPSLHDKIEFECVASVLDLDSERVFAELVASGLSAGDLPAYREALRTLTRSILDRSDEVIADGLARARSLAERLRALEPGASSPEQIPARLELLLAHIQRDGTIPFAQLARLGFVGSSLLRSLVARGLLSQDETQRFARSIRSVSSELVEQLAAVHEGRSSREDFLQRFGHLRAGSYDLLSPRYDQNPRLVFSGRGRAAEHTVEAFALSERQNQAIAQALAGIGLKLDGHGLLRFVAAATAAREEAKFEFTRGLSAALEWIARWGQAMELGREELVHLRIEDICAYSCSSTPQQPERLLQQIARRRLQRQSEESLLLPGLLRSTADLHEVFDNAARPNFVGRARISAPLAVLSAQAPLDPSELGGKLVLIEGADPGYDWLFGHPIAGLITRYGGANSHMTIRCAEFGLPAAIGCGDTLYGRLLHAAQAELDCQAGCIRV